MLSVRGEMRTEVLLLLLMGEDRGPRGRRSIAAFWPFETVGNNGRVLRETLGYELPTLLSI